MSQDPQTVAVEALVQIARDATSSAADRIAAASLLLEHQARTEAAQARAQAVQERASR